MAEQTEISGKINLVTAEVAEMLAASSDEEQGEFFNVFFKALRINCETPFRYDTQLCNIYAKMNDRSKEACKFLTFED